MPLPYINYSYIHYKTNVYILQYLFFAMKNRPFGRFAFFLLFPLDC